ncbi:splicing factor 3B subunit 6-like [Sorex fumeus]|uniref:splicing factor 3B subunit 6-like n=1 Tax=Sorex fumeus TaxID=62283 RepID=UPI0024AE47E9|nr:splicing factor 3B subunit 6-like [Sorex fumeus]
MAMQAAKRANIRPPPEVNRILYIRNLPYKITAEEMYDIFGKYGPIHQIRVGNTPETRGTAYVVYEDILDAKNACDHLSGFNVCNIPGSVILQCQQSISVDGYKEEEGTVETSQGEIWHQYRSTEANALCII